MLMQYFLMGIFKGREVLVLSPSPKHSVESSPGKMNDWCGHIIAMLYSSARGASNSLGTGIPHRRLRRSLLVAWRPLDAAS